MVFHSKLKHEFHVYNSSIITLRTTSPTDPHRELSNDAIFTIKFPFIFVVSVCGKRAKKLFRVQKKKKIVLNRAE